MMNLAQFLNSLSIEAAGELTFDMIIEEGYDTVDKINNMLLLEIAEVGKSGNKMIGLKTAYKIWNSLHSDRVQELLKYSELWVYEHPIQDIAEVVRRIETPTGYMPDQMTFILKDNVSLKDVLKIDVEEDESELKIDLKGKKVLFTGTGPFSRDALTVILKRNGVIVQKGVTKETDILILDDLESIRNKAKKARKYGTKMVTYMEVFRE